MTRYGLTWASCMHRGRPQAEPARPAMTDSEWRHDPGDLARIFAGMRSARRVLGAQIRNGTTALFVFPELMHEALPHRAVSGVSDQRRPRIFGMLAAYLPPGQ